jgi:hypothetical protein
MTVYVGHPDANYVERVNQRGDVQRQFDYFGKTSPHQFGPEAFLVDYGPQRTTVAHFHSVDQFQIFFGAPGGLYQRHAIPPVELHYADAFVTYGPFSAGQERIKFFTLRPCQGQYRGNMPEDRHKLKYRGRRGHHVDLEEHLSAESAPGDVDEVVLISRDDDGLSASLLVAGPRVTVPLPSTHGTSGMYACVLTGGVEVDGTVVGPLTLGWTPPDESESVVRTVDDSVTRLLLMTYPFPPTPQARGVQP